MRPTTWPSGSANIAMRGPSGTSMGPATLLPPRPSILPSVAPASFAGGADAAVDAALYAGVRHRVVRARRPHLPIKGVPVEALEGLGVLADDLDVHYRVTHQLLLSVLPLYRCGWMKSNR